MNTFTQSIKVILLAIVLSFGISYVFAWVPPTQPAPYGNSLAPLNTSATTQTKNGNLFLNALGITNTAPNALSVLGGGVFGGNVTLGYEALSCDAISQGSLRYNSTSKKMEYCDSTAWKEVSTGTPSIATLSSSPSPIATGQSASLAWLFTDAVSCTASLGWSGSKPFNGSETVSPTTTTSYSLACVNGSGGTTTKTVSVDVRQWTNTTGSGNFGQSCDAWLSATGQAGVNGSSPALASKFNGAILSGSNNLCVYQKAPDMWGYVYQWAHPSSNVDASMKPVSAGINCPPPEGMMPLCGYGDYVLKTRR